MVAIALWGVHLSVAFSFFLLRTPSSSTLCNVKREEKSIADTGKI